MVAYGTETDMAYLYFVIPRGDTLWAREPQLRVVVTTTRVLVGEQESACHQDNGLDGLQYAVQV